MPTSTERIADITLDEHGIVRRNPDVEHERAVAVYDILENNRFSPVGDFRGPYRLRLAVEEDRLTFDIRSRDDRPLKKVTISLKPFRPIVKDYFLVCESYYSAIKTASPGRIEAIDVGRKALHDEGSELLRERLAGKIDLDLDTARRLFTLICVLHLRG